MHWDWEEVKDKARRCFEKAAAFVLFENCIGYVMACVVAGHPVGVIAYLRFLVHCCQWGG